MLGIAKARAIPRSVRRGVRQAVSRLPATKQKRASLRVLRYGGSRGKAPPQATNARIGGKPFRWAASRLRTVCCWPCETGWCWEEAGPFSSSGWVARLDGSGPKESCSCRKRQFRLVHGRGEQPVSGRRAGNAAAGVRKSIDGFHVRTQGQISIILITPSSCSASAPRACGGGSRSRAATRRGASRAAPADRLVACFPSARRCRWTRRVSWCFRSARLGLR